MRYFDPSGIRLGTPSLTTRGMREREMKIIARLLHAALTTKDDYEIRKAVRSLCGRFPVRRFV